MLSSFPVGSKVLVQGASGGIGLEFARQLAADPSVDRLFASHRPGRCSSELARIASDHSKVRLLELDVTEESSIASAARGVRQSDSSLDLLVNCSGLLHDANRELAPEKRLAEVASESLLRSFAVNAAGPLLMAKHFEGLLNRTGKAVFASISARVGSIGDNRLGGWYAYRGSKAALNMFTRTLAIEWARSRKNLICVSLHPGTTDTDLSRPYQANVPPGKLFSPERTVNQLLAVLDSVTVDDSGRFLAWDGSEIPW
jgi:NAD(P)-dependent dehydrogenase (short-subunit alcohol dehydrogenase family)